MKEAILQWNIRGLANNFCDLKYLICKEEPAVIALQETHLKPGSKFRIRGYKAHAMTVKPKEGGRAHGGVSFFIRDNLQFTPINLNTNLQAVAVRMKSPFPVTLCCIYLPNGKWSGNSLESLIDNLPAPFIIFGDFNSHNTLWGSTRTDTNGAALEQVIFNRDISVINDGRYTHFSIANGSHSAIDLTIATPSLVERLTWAPLNDLYSSDHYPIRVEINVKKSQFCFPGGWNTKRADWTMFQSALVTPSFTGNVEIDTQAITSSILHAAKATIPYRKPKTVKHGVPWWNTECETARKNRKQAYRRFKRTMTDENMIMLKRATALERKVKRQAYAESLQSFSSSLTSSTPLQEAWNKVNAFMGKKTHPRIPILLDNGKTISDEHSVAELLADHFEEVSSSKSYSTTFSLQKTTEEKKHLDFTSDTHSSWNIPFSMTELEHHLTKAKNTAPGIDGIKYDMLQHLTPSMKIFLLNLYNTIWETSEYPNAWRKAIVIPIQKPKKDPSEATSYRPISLTCCISKVLEGMVNYRLTWLLENLQLIDKFQAGFRRNHSSLDQVAYLEDAINSAYISQKHLVAVFFDLEKAYDTTWRYAVLRQMYEWGIRGNLPKFIKSFLDDRRFSVRLGNTFSRIRTQENGIPQGSVLSVSLFAIAVNDLTKGLNRSVKKSLYVDDIAIFIASKNCCKIQVQLQRAIDTIVKNAESRGFRLSRSKTCCAHFCRLRVEHAAPPLYMNGTRLEYKEEIQYLGVTLDSKLSWKAHIDKTKTKAQQALNQLRGLARFQYGANKQVLLRIVKTLVFPILEYGCMFYSSARKTRLHEIDRIYNTAIKMATGAFRTSKTSNLYWEAGIIKPELRRQYLTLTYMDSLWTKKTHFLNDVLFRPTLREEYHRLQSRIRPLSIRYQDLKSRNEMPEVFPLTSPNIPPWTISKPSVNMTFRNMKKSDTFKIEYLAKFREIVDQLSSASLIYTDGSKTNNHVGCSFYIPSMNIEKAFILNEEASIYTAELMAILKSLEYTNKKNTVICSDSLSSLIAIQDTFSTNSIVRIIIEKIHSLKGEGKNIEFLWIPGHVGIHGNEKADSLAKNACPTKDELELKIPICDIKAARKKENAIVWQNQWLQENNKHVELKPHTRCFPPTQLNRREDIVITRLRIGHLRITHDQLLRGKKWRRCPLCSARLSTIHIIEECEGLQEYFENRNLPRSWKQLLSEKSKHLQDLISLLRDIQILQYI